MARRLSRGNESNILPFVEDEEELVPTVSCGRNSVGRRRLSIGSRVKRSEESLEEQNKIAEMYKTIIKLSTENKINAKNSWNLDLINHMDKLISEESSESGHNGVNFQKASCTLEASIKIYSHRVDDTHTSSYQILENLTRNEHYDEDISSSNEEIKKPARVGSKMTSMKHNLSETIERNLSTINTSSLESEHNTDPMFHKMSQAFDEGGAKGMLMANLRVASGSSTMTFSSNSDLNTDIQHIPGDNALHAFDRGVMPNAASLDLLVRSKIDLHKVLQSRICPSVDKYRDVVGIRMIAFDECLTGMTISPQLQILDKNLTINHTVSTPQQPTECVETTVFMSCTQHEQDTMDTMSEEIVAIKPKGRYSICGNALALCDPDDDDDGDGDNFGGDYGGDGDDMGGATSDGMNIGDVNYSPNSQEQRNDARKSICDSKIQWSAVFGDDSNCERSSISVLDTQVQEVVAGFGLLDINNPRNSASVLNADAFVVNMKGNTWAGAKHWKSSLRKSARVPDSSPSETCEQDMTEKDDVKTKKRSKKEKFSLQFDGTSSISSDVLCDCRSTTLQLTESAIQKALAQQDDGMYDLPIDAKLDVRDLCRMFMWSTMLVPPPKVPNSLLKAIIMSPNDSHTTNNIVGKTSLASGKSTKDINNKIWGETISETNNKYTSKQEISNDFLACNLQSYEYQNDDGDDDNEYHIGSTEDANDYCDTSVAENFNVNESCSNLQDSGGLDVRVQGGMVTAPRIVEKVNIGYATTSKIVNMKKLKSDVWRTVDKECPRTTDSTDANQPSSTPNKKSKISFHDVIADISQSPHSQKEASLSFYFICLLHLANENNLCLQDSKDMSDLYISRGAAQ